jgi:hypothetical protein
MPSKKSKDPKDEVTLRKLSSSDPEARDEGPRLLPLPDEPRSRDFAIDVSNRYMHLAETAMRRKRPKPERPKAPTRKSGVK